MNTKLVWLARIWTAQYAVSENVRWGEFEYYPGTGFYDPSVNAILHGEFESNAGGGWTIGVYLNETLSMYDTMATLTASTEDWLPAWGHLWRQFEEGDTVGYESIFGDHNDYWFHLSDSVYSDRSVTIAQGESVYLGFGVEGDHIYGWVQLYFDGTSVSVQNSAVDIDGDQIQVGQIPEPSITALLLAGAAAIAIRRRRQGDRAVR